MQEGRGLGDARLMASGCEILIIEDDFDIREVLMEVLGDEGFAVAGAANGREGLNLLNGGARPKMILLDLMMPVMNGWQFVEEQRRDARLANLPVVVISAGNNLSQVAGELGASAFLKKPLEIEQLLELVRRYVGVPAAV